MRQCGNIMLSKIPIPADHQDIPRGWVKRYKNRNSRRHSDLKLFIPVSLFHRLLSLYRIHFVFTSERGSLRNGRQSPKCCNGHCCRRSYRLLFHRQGAAAVIVVSPHTKHWPKIESRLHCIVHNVVRVDTSV